MSKMNWDRAKTRDTIRQLDREDRERESARRHRRHTGPNTRNRTRRSALMDTYGRVGVEHAARLVTDVKAYTGAATFVLSLQGQANEFSSEPWWPSVKQYESLAKAFGEEPALRIQTSECSTAPTTPTRSKSATKGQSSSTKKVRHQ